MALTQVDRLLLERCLAREPGAWNDFVDRYLGLVYHVIHYTAHLRSVVLAPEDVEDLAADVLLQIVNNNYSVLRKFEGRSSLATYLTVVARRICVQELARRAAAAKLVAVVRNDVGARDGGAGAVGLDQVEEVERLLARLPKKVRQIVRLHYLEGRSYEEISTLLGVPVNSIGPVLSRAKAALRKKTTTK